MTLHEYDTLTEVIALLMRSVRPRDVQLAVCLKLLMDGFRQDDELQGAIDSLAAWQAARAYREE